MIRRIQRKPLLQKRIAQQAENMLVTALPQEVREVLGNLNTNLREVHNLIDSQLRQTQELSKKAYADLRQPLQSNLAANGTDNGSDNSSPSAAPADPAANAPAPEVPQQLAHINAAINAKFAAMTEAIGKRSQQVSMVADRMQNVAAGQSAPEVAVESALGGE